MLGRDGFVYYHAAAQDRLMHTLRNSPTSGIRDIFQQVCWWFDHVYYRQISMLAARSAIQQALHMHAIPWPQHAYFNNFGQQKWIGAANSRVHVDIGGGGGYHANDGCQGSSTGRRTQTAPAPVGQVLGTHEAETDVLSSPGQGRTRLLGHNRQMDNLHVRRGVCRGTGRSGRRGCQGQGRGHS